MLGYWLFDADSAEPQGTAHGSPILAGTTALVPPPIAQAISVALKP